MLEGDIWRLVFGIVIFLIFILILAAILCAICGGGGCCGRTGNGNKCGKKKKCESCCVKQAYLSRHGTGVITLSEDDTLLLEMTWNDPGITRPCGAHKPKKCSPCDNTQWKPVFDTTTTQALTGFTVPESGNYWMEYHLGMVTNGAIGLVLVNGVPVADSASWSLDVAETLPTCGRQLNKSFMLHLNCGDVVSIIIFVFITDNFFIDSFYNDGNFKFLTTMALHLQDPDRCNCSCKVPSGGSIPVLNNNTNSASVAPSAQGDTQADGETVFRLDDRAATQSALIEKARGLAQYVATANPIDPAHLIATFLNTNPTTQV